MIGDAPAGGEAAPPRPGARDEAPRPGHKRSTARLAAVQALYQVELSAAPAEDVVAEFLRHRLGQEIEGSRYADADRDHFAWLVRSTAARLDELDRLVLGVLAESWTMARLGALMRALMRAAACELLERADVPARVVINEYVDLARAFFADREPAFVNGALDRLARRLRPDEFTSSGAVTGPAAPVDDPASEGPPVPEDDDGGSAAA